jgi:hypothetical protein
MVKKERRERETWIAIQKKERNRTRIRKSVLIFFS